MGSTSEPDNVGVGPAGKGAVVPLVVASLSLLGGAQGGGPMSKLAPEPSSSFSLPPLKPLSALPSTMAVAAAAAASATDTSVLVAGSLAASLASAGSLASACATPFAPSQPTPLSPRGMRGMDIETGRVVDTRSGRRLGPKQPWLPEELERLHVALATYGRNWVKVQEYVGTKNRRQCESKVLTEVSAGRMAPPCGKQVQLPWTKLETAILRLSVAKNGRDWATVSADVGTKTKQQCENKVTHEVSAGRMPEPARKQEHHLWSNLEVARLTAAVAKHGRNWVAVSKEVGTKTNQQCQDKVTSEVIKGRMAEPAGVRKRHAWTKGEVWKLKNAVQEHGRDWGLVSEAVSTKDRQQCLDKVNLETAAGRMGPNAPNSREPDDASDASDMDTSATQRTASETATMRSASEPTDADADA
jgi:hypothetical protein